MKARKQEHCELPQVRDSIAVRSPNMPCNLQSIISSAPAGSSRVTWSVHQAYLSGPRCARMTIVPPSSSTLDGVTLTALLRNPVMLSYVCVPPGGTGPPGA